MAGDVLGLVELLEDVLREDLAELNTHLVWPAIVSFAHIDIR